jgi:hypothetical protein
LGDQCLYGGFLILKQGLVSIDAFLHKAGRFGLNGPSGFRAPTGNEDDDQQQGK